MVMLAGCQGDGRGMRPWVSFCLYVLICLTVSHLTSCRRNKLGPAAHGMFMFTQLSYNVTISENSVGKTFVNPTSKMGLYMEDPSLRIKYRISKGDDDKIFKPEEEYIGDFCFLRIRTRSGIHQALNRERQDTFALTVKAVSRSKSEPMLTAQTEVIVHILDANDLTPLFYPTSYTVEVPENTTIHKPITKVTAEDADVGINGEIYYSFEEKTETFSIHPTSGVITLTRELSYIEHSFYELTILAEDRGPKIGYGYIPSKARLQVRVLEVNFYAPEIDIQELPAVVEHGGVGTVYAILYVHDKDYGDNGQIERVSIISGNEQGFFRLQHGTRDMQYTIQVARNLDREIDPDGFNLTIAATDRGKPPRTTTRVIHVQLADINDQVPRFESSVYEVTVDELVPLYTPLVVVKAGDSDILANGRVQYGIMSGNDLKWFSIDAESGLVYVSGNLDTEIAGEVVLILSAQDMGNAGVRKSTTTQLRVTITDCNDNAPSFNATSMIVQVKEAMPVNTPVHQVSAFDNDQGDNGYISYSIANIDVPFSINHFTGLVSTTSELDYESMKRLYRLRIRASDWGSPFRRESEMILKVKLRDMNDNKPKFEKVNCTGYLSREAPLGTKLVTVPAIDFDAGNIISYQILNGNEDGCFEMSASTGDVKLNCDLRNHRDTVRGLSVTATDGINSADPMTINITLVNNARNIQLSNRDANVKCQDTRVTEELSRLLKQAADNNQDEDVDEMINIPNIFTQNVHTPRFPPGTPKKIQVKEGLPLGHKLLSLKAEDPDPGYNGRLIYVISNPSVPGVFKMDTYTGDLTVMGEVDREVKNHFELNVTVYDMGQPPRSAFTILVVEVEDINDCAPEFEKTSYSVSINENIPVNTSILQIAATDKDLSENALVSYSLLTNTEDFLIDHELGIIYVNSALDRERQDKYELVVQATDHTENPLSSTVTVIVSLEDINDNAPKFQPESYTVRVREDLPVGSVVMTITANDEDLGGGGIVRYALQDGTEGKFDIDRQTGTIRIAQKLNFEEQQVYNITARAKDRGEPSLSSRCSIVVEVIDVDENLFEPVFSEFVYQGSVSENLEKGTSVLQVLALDNDKYNEMASQRDYDVVYSIRNGTGLGVFTIDDKGVIKTNEVLDRESEDHYWLTVYAQDQGTVPRSAFVDVYIEVSDINDNVPLSLEPVYYPSVQENSEAETSVILIQAADEDDPDSKQLTYDITGGNPQAFFTINRFTGLITTTSRKLDREKQEEHILEVTITDSGSPPLSSTTRVVVTVTDDNDESPQFTERIYHVRIPEMAGGSDDTPLYRVVAYDLDSGPNGDLDFSIKDNKGNRFKIHPKTGMISSQKRFERGENYDITVKAVDNGRPQQKESCRVIIDVIARPVESPHPPVFVEEAVEVSVAESDPVGGFVKIMSATDEDDEKLWYSLISEGGDDKFRIDPENGNIVIAQTLDWETTNHYNLTIKVTDGVHETHTWMAVKVIDINDHRPEFTESSYEVSVLENTARGTDIITISATDQDEDQRLFYTIHSSTDPLSRTKFKINSETDSNGAWKGVITTMDELNREAMSQHELTIMVRDQGTPSKRSLARIIINVEDHNDHAPVFLSPVYTGRVFETSALGTAVLTVQAMDRDTGQNAQIKYSILSGNIGSVFSIDRELGIISVAKQLERSVQSTYKLVVKATDGGSPSLTSTAEVEMHVTISDNAPPKFTMEEYTTELHENEPKDTFVISVQATCKSSVHYEIVKGNNNGFFTVNPNSGVISTTDVIDFEKYPFFNLTVRATNMVHATAQSLVLIHIIDENDNFPVFTQAEYIGNISEGALINSVILDRNNTPLVIKANDPDTDLNALLIYSIIDSTAEEYFAIDANTGAIRTKRLLDHETTARYQFQVQVTDMGQPMRSAEVPAKVTIHVVDINDCPPVFTESVYEASLTLPTYENVVVVTVKAHDNDSALHSKLKYTIIGTGADDVFTIDSETGAITVTRTDVEKNNYEFNVKVSDGSFQNNAVVKIKVGRTEVTGLHFTKERYEARIRENRTGIEQVAVVQAMGHSLNEQLSFKILNPNDLFKLGTTSGVVLTTGTSFDREVQENYTLVIEVKDERDPPRVAHTLLHVQIEDANDNIPVFVNQPYYAIVSVDAVRGETVLRVTALDRDIGPNSDIRYHLVEGGDNKFSVNPLTGEIKINAPLQVEDQHKEFSLLIQAQDQGDVPQSTRVNVPIKIMNEATPVFEKQFYTVSISENTPLHSAIITIEASSPTGSKLIYSITNGDVYGEFSVDFSTGAITLTDLLDYEMRKTYDLTLRAADTMTGSYSEAIVHVLLMDVNDNAPKFTSMAYTATVSEAASIGTSLLTVSATDADSGENAHVIYTLQNISDDGQIDHFHIDSDKGLILTKQQLDHETRPFYDFLVVANDNGIPSLSTTVRVRITVQDLNDNAPKFDRPVYEVTIMDLAKRGQFVTIVTASDQDSLDSGHLTYSIVGGNDKQSFVIDEHTGILSLSSLRRPDLQPQYSLNVSVTDGVFTNFAKIQITVESSNNFVPTFTHGIFDVDVTENLSPGQSITTVIAADADHGLYGTITYSINSQFAQEYFRIDEETGELFTRVELDRELKVVYDVPIRATDGGGRSGYTMVRVNVADQGDNRPLFKMQEYKANIYGASDVGAYVLQVSAIDKDLGPSSEIIFSIMEGSEESLRAAEYFDINHTTGLLSLKKSVTHLQNQLFQFFVRGTDKGSPPIENDVPVEVYIMDPEDEPPRFDQDLYTYFIPEDRPVATIIATVSAKSNSSIKYNIIPGNMESTNNPAKFAIDQDGKITVIEALDREETETFELMVMAQTYTSPPLVAYTQITVKIMDLNDNNPRFESDPYQVTIAENAEIGSKVVQVIAHDKDTGANADISYDFAPEHKHLSNIFAVDSQTGWITTLVMLDRETKDKYRFDIEASDRGAMRKLTETVSVDITITDHNDEPPVFSQAVYTGAVNEDADSGTIILSITTTDKDLGPNAKVAYSITNGDDLNQFSVGTMGEMYVNKKLDRETKSWYDLTISATDGAFVTTARVQITILDANDNSPVCESPEYEETIAENVPVGSFVVRITATDADEPETRNSRIEYALTGFGSHNFIMHQTSGIISTGELLDREAVPKYHLQVTATDGGGRSCTSDVYISLSDVNDNEPTFSRDTYTVAVAENAEVNTLLTRVSAIDYDLGINRKVRYAMKESDGRFVIDPISGIVSLMRPLDREVQASYNLTLYAHDQGTPKMTSRAYLIVHLLDVNDNPPEFEHSIYVHEVREDAQVGVIIMSVYATSRDTGVNAEISYSINAGNEQGKFRIDSKTGSLMVVQPLDYESTREYVLTVMATDGGTPALSNTAIIRINVTDANDNFPTFPQKVYNAVVAENAQLAESITQVLASDMDSEENAELIYRLHSGDEGKFAITYRSGIITTMASLDRETTPFYNLVIEVVDSGQPRLTGSTTVHIEVQDYNDNPPRFAEDNYTAVVQEDQEIGYVVVNLEVTDLDIDMNGAPFSYDIISGNENNEFMVNREGIISTTSTFNRDIKDTYQLVIRVFDNGNPPLFSDAKVMVKVIEESAFPPVVQPLQVKVTVYNDEYPGGVIGKVKARDPDMFDRLVFSIVSDNTHLFEVDALDGRLRAIQPLDAGDYRVNVSVSDGKYFTYTEIKLQILGISDDVAENAVVVRFQHMLPEEFVTAHKKEFLSILQQELGVSENDVLLLSIQPATNTVVQANRRNKRSTDSNLDVLLAVKKSENGYMKGKVLQRRLNNNLSTIENRLRVKVLKIFNDVCEKDMCDQGLCRTEIIFQPETMFPIITDNESIVTVRHQMAYRCRCKSGFQGTQCAEEVDACNPNPCPAPHVCLLEGNLGYKCECPEGRTGSNCEETCIGHECQASLPPLSFSGQSFAKWHFRDPMERRFSMSFHLRTVQRSARLMHAVGRVDYSILEMQEGMIQYKFDCGSGPGLVRVDSVRVNDGSWHFVVVERRGNSAEIVIDSQHMAESSAPGTNDVLNLDSNKVFFGAEVIFQAHGYMDIRRGLEGCMKDIKVSGVALPYSGSNIMGTFERFENVEFECKQPHVSGICGLDPCQNGGTCLSKGPDAYVCTCPDRFVGALCEVDTNPCASMPCLHGGTCENMNNDFRCLCPGTLKGKTCLVGFYCARNPCKHGSTCVDEMVGPRCVCPRGFEGEYCERDINECLDNPCMNGGECQNRYGSFHCNCTPETVGERCEEVILATIKSSPFNITIEEIIGIAGVVAGLLLVVIVCVLIVRWRRRKRRQRELHMMGANSHDEYLVNDNLKPNNKNINCDNDVTTCLLQNIPPSPRTNNMRRPSPPPPPVPTRPASYTPSTADSVHTLNNFDTLHNYGSAGDELENAGLHQHIEIPEFLQNVDVEKSPAPMRNSYQNHRGHEHDKLQKKWDPNFANNYPEGEHKKQNKKIPVEPQMVPPLPIRQASQTVSSVSSLPLSESDDDMLASGPARAKRKGYHWDTSDWAPNPTLPNITEVPMNEIPDSPSSSRSNESNAHINPDEYEYTDYPDETVDSEYVGDSEYAENECDDDEDDIDDPNAHLLDPPNYEQILAMHGDLNYDDSSYVPQNNYVTHPNQYLPSYQLDNTSQNDNGNEDDVIHYGFPRPSHPRFSLGDGYNTTRSGYNTDGAISGIDEMSVSMGGYTSTNASVSDISGLCEIEDSEANLSDNDSVDENNIIKLSNSHTHTQV